jgi:hypothetical protein
MGDLIWSIAAFLVFGAVCGYLGWTIRDHRARCQDALRLARRPFVEAPDDGDRESW